MKKRACERPEACKKQRADDVHSVDELTWKDNVPSGGLCRT